MHLPPRKHSCALTVIVTTLLPLYPVITGIPMAGIRDNRALGQQGLTSTQRIAPGVVYSTYRLAGPLVVQVVEVSRGTPGVTLESYRAAGLARTSEQAAENDTPGHRVVAAINADFFSLETRAPVGNQVVRGEVVLGIPSTRSHIAVDSCQRPRFERLSFRGWVRSANGSLGELLGVNIPASGNRLVWSSPRTPQNRTGAWECPAVVLKGTGAVGETLQCVVTWSAPAGERELPPGAGLLAGTGKGAEFLSRNVEQGDTVSVFLGYNLQLPGVHHVLGGAGRILAGGRDVSDSMAVVEGIKPSFLSARHPRTFVAINRDTTRVFLCTVDGRQTSSIGMTFGEMADFLQDIGAWDGINLDGGGSTTMVIRAAVVNSPSDPSGERPVANSLHVIAPGFPLR